MKKAITLLMCALILISASACGKKSDKCSSVAYPENETAESSAKEETENDKSVEATTEDAEADDENLAETGELSVESAEQLQEMVDEFNNTDDPERKEEIRAKLEKILERAEQMAGE